MKYFVSIVIAAVALMIIAGFFFIGSPVTERMRQFDNRRVNDLQMIQGQVVSYWQSKQKLPDDLSQLNDDISGFRVPMDPEKGTSYEYQKTGDVDFKLCAEFSLETFAQSAQPAPMPYSPYGASPETWQHLKGRNCFDRHIDKDLYPPRVPAPAVK